MDDASTRAAPATSARFDPDAFGPDASPGAMRYLTRAIAPGTPLARRADITFTGRVRLRPDGAWMPFRAVETIVAGRSFQVTAKARKGPLTVTVEDRYEAGRARSRIRAFGLITVRSQNDRDLARSSRGRLIVESTWLPSAFIPSEAVRWSQEPDSCDLSVTVDGEDVQAAFRLEPGGELAELNLLRWTDLTDDRTYGWVPFSARVAAHRSFDGYTIPSDVTATWHAGTKHEFDFFHAVVQEARFSE